MLAHIKLQYNDFKKRVYLTVRKQVNIYLLKKEKTTKQSLNKAYVECDY